MLDLYFRFILGDDDTYLSGSDKLIVREWIKNNYRIYGDLSISDDLVVDCKCSVDIKNKSITSLTNGLFRWGSVGRDFYCSCCKKLKSLEGAPKNVGGNFNCSRCDSLVNLEGAPKKVGGDFYCHSCVNLKSLEGAPKEVNGSFNCIQCVRLESLKGSPKKVVNGFYCNGCNNLTSLEGAPVRVGSSFLCDNCNNLTSLKGAPDVVGEFVCNYCPNLKITDSDRERYKLHEY